MSLTRGGRPNTEGLPAVWGLARCSWAVGSLETQARRDGCAVADPSSYGVECTLAAVVMYFMCHPTECSQQTLRGRWCVTVLMPSLRKLKARAFEKLATVTQLADVVPESA